MVEDKRYGNATAPEQPCRPHAFRRCPICQRDMRVTLTHSQVVVTDLASSDRGHVANLSHPHSQAWQSALVCSGTDNLPQRRPGQSGDQRRPHKVSTIHRHPKGSIFSMNRSCLRCKTAENFASQVQLEGTPNIHPGLIPSPCWNIALEILTTNSPWDTKVAQASRTCERAVLRRVVSRSRCSPCSQLIYC